MVGKHQLRCESSAKGLHPVVSPVRGRHLIRQVATADKLMQIAARDPNLQWVASKGILLTNYFAGKRSCSSLCLETSSHSYSLPPFATKLCRRCRR